MSSSHDGRTTRSFPVAGNSVANGPGGEFVPRNEANEASKTREVNAIRPQTEANMDFRGFAKRSSAAGVKLYALNNRCNADLGDLKLDIVPPSGRAEPRPSGRGLLACSHRSHPDRHRCALSLDDIVNRRPNRLGRSKLPRTAMSCPALASWLFAIQCPTCVCFQSVHDDLGLTIGLNDGVNVIRSNVNSQKNPVRVRRDFLHRADRNLSRRRVKPVGRLSHQPLRRIDEPPIRLWIRSTRKIPSSHKAWLPGQASAIAGKCD